jgi:phospholipase C
MASGSPIHHVVIMVKENHAFDNYFGTFPGAEGDATLAPCPDPPHVSSRHDHQAWLERAAHAVHQQYAQEISRPTLPTPSSSPCATTTLPT